MSRLLKSDLTKAIIALVVFGVIGDLMLVNAEALGLPKGLGLWDSTQVPVLAAVVIIMAALAVVLFVLYRSIRKEPR